MRLAGRALTERWRVEAHVFCLQFTTFRRAAKVPVGRCCVWTWLLGPVRPKKKSMGREETKVTATWCSNEKVRIRLLSGRMLAKVIFKVLIFLIVQVRLCCLVMSEPKHPGRAELSYPKMFAESPVGGAKDMGRRIREKDSQVLTILVYIWSNVFFSYFNPEFPLSLS